MASMQINGRSIGLRELTVGEVRDWLQSLAVPDAGAEIDLADVLLFQDEGIRLSDFTRLTDLSLDDLQRLTPAELADVLAKCREVNPRFFLVLGRVLALGQMSLQRQQSMASKPPALRSRNWFTRMFTPGRGAG